MKALRLLAAALVAALSLWTAPGTVLADAYYQLTPSAYYTWDGTAGNRLLAESADYKFDYGDSAAVSFDLPWNFTFYGQNYTRITADTNGNIWLGTTLPVPLANSFSLASTGLVISVWNNDLSSYYDGGVFIERKTIPDRVVVHWRTETFVDAGYGRGNEFEAVLFADGTIRFDYKSFAAQAIGDFGSGISRGYGLHLPLNGYGAVTSLGQHSFTYAPDMNPPLSIDPTFSPTNVLSQTLSGTREAGATVVVSADPVAEIGDVIYPTETSWRCSVPLLSEGVNTLTVTSTDAVGHISTQSAVIVLDTMTFVTFDPVISPTNALSRELSGTMEVGAVVTVLAENTTTTIGQVIYPTTTSWKCVVSGLVEGENFFTVTATDAVGNVSTGTVSIVRDTIPPNVTITPPVSPTPSVTVELSGTREPDATISVSISPANSTGSVSYPSPTSWACALPLQYDNNTITVTATDAVGNSAAATTTVMRYRVPVDFMAIPATGGVPFVVTFTNLSQSAVSWLWDFGDGSTSTESNPAHVYRSAGSYAVTLTTNDGSLQKTNFILATACQNPPFRIESSTPLYFSSLWDARIAALNGETIQMMDQTVMLPEVIALDRDITLDGGFDCSFTTKTGQTILKGNMEITGGTAIINDAIIDMQ